MEILLSILGGLAVGGAAAWLIRENLQKKQLAEAQTDAQTIVEKARANADDLKEKSRKELQDERRRFKKELDHERQEHKHEQRKVERRLEKREGELDRQQDKLSNKERNLDDQKAKLEAKTQKIDRTQEKLDKALDEEREKLLQISQLSEGEARDIVMRRFEEECEGDLAKFVERQEESRKERAEEIAQRVVGTAIQRCAVRYTSEAVTSVIDLPSDDMKGRIIGREGRNIRAIEKATGVDVIVDDTPGVIVISCFDAVRREIARKALSQLIQDGRVHPARVEELVEQHRKEIDEDIRQTGRKTCQELQLGRVHPQVQYLVGRLKYRTSYGQNVLQHSIEVAHIMSSMAAELKLDPMIGKRCGLLHDIGKALTHELDGSHAVIGAEQARRFDEPRRIWNAIGAHHEDMPYESVYAVLTQVGDAISAARPGARRDTIERYIERLEKLEKTATDFDGVVSAYAVQAGREIRVLVDPDKMSDDRALLTARDIAKKIEDELTYPGEIRVTLVRERRVTEVAR